MAAMTGKIYLERFGFGYSHVHIFLAPIICISGIIIKIISIIVLKSRNMSSPTSAILTWLAISEAVLMTAYLPTVFMNDHTIIATLVKELAHSISVWLMVILTAYRYLTVVRPRYGRQLCHLRRVRITMATVCVVVPLIALPGACCFSLQGTQRSNHTWLDVKFYNDLCHHPIYDYVRVGVNALFVTAIPCFVFTFLTALLIRRMKSDQRKRTRLFNRDHFQLGEKIRASRRMTNRTRIILISVVLLFLLSEIPHGILHSADGIWDDFNNPVCPPTPLNDLFDFLCLFSSNINFVLICTMSKRFRDTFNTKLSFSKIKNICRIEVFTNRGGRQG